MQFEWDIEKELANIQKHRISFSESTETFFDPKGFQIVDKKHSEQERRYYWIGKTELGRVLTTWFARRDQTHGPVIRIIGCAEWRKFRELYYEATKNA